MPTHTEQSGSTRNKFKQILGRVASSARKSGAKISESQSGKRERFKRNVSRKAA